MTCLTARAYEARFVLVGMLFLSGPSSAWAQDTREIEKIVGDQIRSQGFACTNPSTAVRDDAQSTPGKPVYELKCDEATYQVRIVPDQAAQVTKIN